MGWELHLNGIRYVEISECTMFGLFKKKQVDLAGLPLEEIKFTSEDLFVLMGGFDIGSVAVNGRRFPWREVERGDEVARWRRQVVNRYAPAGLVDAEGRPQGRLAEVLRPFAKPGLGIVGSTRGSLSRFNVEMAIWGDEASFLSVAAGDGLFTVASAGAPDQWAASFARAFGLEGRFRLAERAWHCDFLMGPADKGLNTLLLGKDAAGIRDLAATKGFDARPLLDIVAGIEAAKSVDALKLTTIDLRGVELDRIETPSGTFANNVPAASSAIDMRVKRMSVLPEYGWVATETTAPRTGLPANWRERGEEYRLASRFFSGDLIADTDLFDFVTDVRDCPAELGGVPSGQPCRPIEEDGR